MRTNAKKAMREASGEQQASWRQGNRAGSEGENFWWERTEEVTFGTAERLLAHLSDELVLLARNILHNAKSVQP